VAAVCVHVLCCGSGMCTCFVLWQRYVYMFCIVTAVCVHVLCCDSGMCSTCFVLWQRYVYMFCVVTAVCVVHVLCCDSGKRRENNFEHHLPNTTNLRPWYGLYSYPCPFSSPRSHSGKFRKRTSSYVFLNFWRFQDSFHTAYQLLHQNATIFTNSVDTLVELTDASSSTTRKVTDRVNPLNCAPEFFNFGFKTYLKIISYQTHRQDNIHTVTLIYLLDSRPSKWLHMIRH